MNVDSILIADKDSKTVSFLRSILIQAGYPEPIQVYNSFDLLKQQKKAKPDIIFLEFNLPKDGGLKVLDSILKSDSYCYVIMMFDNPSAEDIQAAKKGGSQGFLAKPFVAGTVIKLLKKYST